MRVFEQLGLDMGWFVIGALATILILLILIIVLFVKNSRLNKKYKQFMNGKDAISLEESMKERFDQMDLVKEILQKHQQHLTKIDESLTTTYQKCGIVKYDAFKEMGGALSFALCLLNESNNGFIINSMHSNREGCYTYVKEIIRGESFIVLAQEEQEALNKAIKCNDLIQD